LAIINNKTAEIPTTKEKGQQPSRRNFFAYPRERVHRYCFETIDLPGNMISIDPADYNAAISNNLRHTWAVHTIKSALNMSLRAKAMVHSQSVHDRTPQR